ncbi:MAG: cell wall-binding protein, partial [Lachnospiraceae bacterium]|nr:cell wall-binding protein [Lachnospiraceae bacterium]
STFYFNEGSYAGRGYTGVKNNYLYYMGKRQEAEDGMKYTAITIEDDGEKKTYVVNESGRVQKGKEVKDDDDNKYKTDSNGILTHYNGSEIGSRTFEDPIEPVFEE